MIDDDLSTDLFLYLCGDLEDDAARAIEARLAAGDPEILAAHEEAQRLFDGLAGALPEVTPRPESRHALMARVEADLEADLEDTASNVVAIAPRSTRWRTAFAAAAILALGFGLGWQLERMRVTGVEAELAATRAEAARVREALGRVESTLAGREAELEAARTEAARLAARQDDERARAGAAASQNRDALAAARDESDRLRDRIASLESRLADTLAAVDRSSLAAQQDRVERDAIARALEETTDALHEAEQALAVVRAPDVGLVDLFGTGGDDLASATVFWDAALESCYLHATGLPKLGAGEHFALWLELDDASIFPVTQFEANARGQATAFAALPGDGRAILRTFVTREGREVTAAPRGPIVLEERASEDGSTAPKRRGRYRRRG